MARRNKRNGSFTIQRFLPCRDVLNGSPCTREACPFAHNLIICDLCGVLSATQGAHEQHLAGKKHRAASALQAANRAAVENPEDQRESATTPPLLEHSCAICAQIFATPDEMSRHLKSPKHVTKARFAKYIETKRISEAGREGLHISPGEVDFELVEFDSLDARPTRAKTLTISMNREGSYSLERISMRSERAGRRSRTFTCGTDINLPYEGRYNSPHNFLVVFDPRGAAGTFTDQIIFEFLVNGSTFVITRTVRAVVGDLDAQREFGPVAPYVAPPPPQDRPSDDDVIPGIPTDAVQGIKYTRRLHMYPIPAFFMTTLGVGTISEQIRKARRNLLPSTLNKDTHKTWFSALVHIEQIQAEIDIQRYDLKGVPLRAGSLRPPHLLYYLEVPGLAEKRPSVLRGDSIRVRQVGTTGKWYEGIVHSISQNEAGLKFHPNFIVPKGAKFDCLFSVPRIPIRRCLQALEMSIPSEILFPSVDKVYQAHPTAVQIRQSPFISSQIERNERQRMAVLACVFNTHSSSPLVIFGPPGTGKTVTLIEAVRQLLRLSSAASSKITILLCAPSNSAADLLATRLLSLGPKIVFRMNAPSRSVESTILSPLCFVTPDSVHGPPSYALPSSFDQFRVIVSTCSSAAMLTGVGLPRGHFSHVFIDEAGQAGEAEACVPLALASPSTSVILVGDPCQLGPIIRSRVAGAFHLDKSLLERIMEHPHYDPANPTYHGVTVVKLVENYRNHPQILSYPNQEFYNGDLVPCADVAQTHSLLQSSRSPFSPNFPREAGFPIIFHAIKGNDDREANSPSFFNVAEISEAKRYYTMLRESCQCRDQDIGVISPYNAQVQKIRRNLRATDVKVGSTEEFQGQERKVIIISTVRSNEAFLEFDRTHSLGFLSNPRRFNVAVTRAQAGLIIIGDPTVLQLDPLWCAFLVYIYDNGGWRGQTDWDPTPFRDNPRHDPAAVARDEMEQFTRELQRLEIQEELEAGANAGLVVASERPWVREE